MTLKYHAVCSGIFLQYAALFSGTLSIITSGMHHGWPSPTLPQLLNHNSTIHLTNEQGSWLAVTNLIGSIPGSLIGAIIPNAIGRKNSTLLSCVPYIIGWIMIAYGESAAVFMSARFIAGISDGIAFCALPIFLSEIASPKIRGALGSTVSVSWIFGTLLINVIGSYLSIKMTALVSTAIPILCLVTFVWLPETPYYCLMKGDKVQARKNLERFWPSNHVEGDLERISSAVKQQNEKNGKYLDLFRVRSNRKALIIIVILRTVQQFSGVNAIAFYAQTIFDKTGFLQSISGSESTMIYFSVQVLCCCVCSVLVDKAGRRPLLIISALGSGLALILEASFLYLLEYSILDTNRFGWVPLVALILYIICFSLGLQTIPVLMSGELFPINVKAFALCVIEIYFGLLATVASKFFQFTKDNYGMFVPFFVFSAFCFIGLVLIIIFVPETKNKTLEDIIDELNSKHKINQVSHDCVQ